MIKKCIGCGVTLQTNDANTLGFTPDINKDYCKRCFRLKHYGEIKTTEINDLDILNKVNKQKGLVFYLCDYLNINKYTINLYNKIKLPKVFIVSKCDLLRKEMKYLKIKKWLEEVYNIKEVLFISNYKTSNNIFKYMDKYNYKTCYIMGITNAGKSTFINKLLSDNKINKEILTSNKENTTLDFIKLKINDYIIYDTPGFNYNNIVNTKEIKQITYNINENTTIIIDNLKLYFKDKNIITLYTYNNNIKREYQEINLLNEINVLTNSDIVIPSIGFINVKNKCLVKSNIKDLEVRKSISGVNYE